MYLAKKTSAAVSALERLFSEFDLVSLFMPADGAFYPQPLLYRLCGRMDDADGDDALMLFHPADRVMLEAALTQLAQGSGQRELQLRLACGEAAHRPEKLVLERISIDGVHASVLKVAEWDETTSSERQDTAGGTLVV